MVPILLSGGPVWVFVKLVTLVFALASVVQMLPARDRQVPNFRARPLRAAFTYGGGSVAAAALIAGCAALATAHPARIAHRESRAAPRLGLAVPRVAVGVVTNNVAVFDAVCSCRPQIAVRYMRFGQPFPAAEVRMMLAHGAEPLIELEPYSVRLASIAAGRSDAWLRSYASSVRALGAPVLLSFAPEANGTWYSWGYGHAAARDFIAAWRHVVTLFRHIAPGARWLWVVNISFKDSEPLAHLWPGSGYVNEIGVDGYFTRPGATFASRFGPTISQIRHVTSKPVLITETAANPAAGKARAVAQLVSAVKRYKLAGFIWFSIDQLGNGDPGAPKTNRNDWSLEDDPAALAAYRVAVKSYR